jgi:ABC-type lipoprotein export system ATPase subunit
MKRLAKEENRAIIVVTHDPEVAKMTDKILLLRDGILVEELVTEFFKPSGIDMEEVRAKVQAEEEASVGK